MARGTPFTERQGRRRRRQSVSENSLRVAVTIVLAAGITIGAATRLGGVSHAAGDPMIAAAGDIACDPGNTNFNGGAGQGGVCMQKATYNLIAGMSPAAAAVLPLGDNQYYCGGYQAFVNSYALSWGKLLSKTYPVVGNHEYLVGPGSDGVGTGCDSSNAGAAGYFKYFAGAANEGAVGNGWYSYTVGSWHLIAINSNCPGGCGTTSPQGKWLATDLAAHKNQCIAAYWHIPLWSSGGRAASNTQSIVNQLYNAHADVILAGHDHIYERFAQQSSSGVLDPQNGIREFIVGTGGANHTSIATVAANSQVRDASNFGILKLTLHSGSYDWAFVNTAGTVLDQGSNACHNAGTGVTAPPAPTVTQSETDASDYVSGSTVYYRQGASGSFSVAATSAGATSVTFPTIAGMSGGGLDNSAPFSTTYTRTSTTAATGSFGVTATNTGGTSAATLFTVTPDSVAPTTAASCSPSSCAAAGGGSVAVTLASNDSGSGVDSIYYTTNGTTPTIASSTIASGSAVTVPAGAAVKFFAVDRVGNQEAVKTQPTTITAGGGGGGASGGDGGGPGGGGVALQQQKSGSATSAATLTVALTPTAPGNALVATIAVAAGSTGAIASVSDSSAGIWTKGPIGFLSGANTRVEIWYRLGAPSVTSVTASFASGTTKSLAMNVSEWSGVATTSGVDASATASGTATLAATAALSTSNASDVVIGAVNYSGTATSTLTSPFISLSNFDVGSNHGRAAYLATSSTGSYQANWPLSTSTSYGSAILALKASGSGGSPPSPPPAPVLLVSESDASDFVNGSTVYYRQGAGGGSFQVAATSSGATSVTFPPIAGMSGGGATSTSPFTATYSWTATTSASGPFSVTASNGSTSSPTSFTVTPDADAPQSSITCNGGSDCDGSYTGNVQVTLSASDSGSGVDKIYYTTDGTTTPGPGSGSSTTNASTISVPAGSTLQYRAADNVGNLENTHSKTLAGAAPPAPVLLVSESDASDFVNGSTVYYRQGAGAAPSRSRRRARGLPRSRSRPSPGCPVGAPPRPVRSRPPTPGQRRPRRAGRSPSPPRTAAPRPQHPSRSPRTRMRRSRASPVTAAATATAATPATSRSP